MPPKAKIAKKTKVQSPKKMEAAKKRKVPDHSSFNKSIYRVLKQVHPNHSMGKKTMDILNSFCHDFFSSVCDEARDITNRHKGRTVGGREV